ncbi:tol-pal system YbgF family protein [Melioribacteraceae bacterium 4301-Me]|uniref:tetratricopeptide repeat protein n=1 Tax=Pyranulibacter aquaticus TaxID=3163344 RepID=UPI00359B68A1
MLKNHYVYLLLVFLIACSTKSDKEYFEEANKLLEQKKYGKAIESYEELVKHHSKSDLAAKALFACGKIYQSQLLPNIPKQASLNKAIQYYRELYFKYGNKPEAEKALFMIAFIQANELNLPDSAKVNYDLFLQKYPKSELTESAKLERDNLGLSPDEILTKKLENKKNDPQKH